MGEKTHFLKQIQINMEWKYSNVYRRNCVGNVAIAENKEI
jgi:hypothetical protein